MTKKITLGNDTKFFIDLAKIHAIMQRRFDNGLGGLGFNEFIILFHLSQTKNETMRRIDLAEKVGLTASGITRLLLPMEKIGLVKKEVNDHDARVSLISIAPGGKRKFVEAIERTEIIVDDIFSAEQKREIKKIAGVVAILQKNLR
jgi:DNA-binding MarR family transcriptional regulator